MHGRKQLILLSFNIICMFRLCRKASADFVVFRLAHLTFHEPEDPKPETLASGDEAQWQSVNNRGNKPPSIGAGNRY